MGQTINIHPITRIEGHASIAIQLDDQGEVRESKVRILSLRGFEKFVEGKPAEELPRIVNRICGICPWQHHLASNKAVDRCFGVTPPPAGRKLRELMQAISHSEDKILHFYFLAAPDFVMGPDSDYSVRNIIGVAKANPDLAKRVVRMRQMAKIDPRDLYRQGHPSPCGGSGGIFQASSGRRPQGFSGQDAGDAGFCSFHH